MFIRLLCILSNMIGFVSEPPLFPHTPKFPYSCLLIALKLLDVDFSENVGVQRGRVAITS